MKFTFMLFLTGVCLAYKANAQEAEAACKPNYQVEYEACKPTDKIVGFNPVQMNEVRVSNGACQPDDNALCNAFPKQEVLKDYPDVKPQSVRLERAYHKDTVGKFCGGLTNLRAKVDVYCDFSFQAPRHEMVADPSCPIQGATDQAGCFNDDKKELDLSIDAINGCLNSKPRSVADLWIKSACLVDVYKAQNSFRLKSDLSPDIYNRMEVQLKAIQNRRSTPESISQYIHDQLGK